MRRLAALFLSVVLCAGYVTGAARAQDVGIVQSRILVIDPGVLFEQSLLGQAITAEIQAQREAIIARNRDIEAELEAEEQALTDLRDTTPPDEFRALADAFDEKVQDLRRESEARVRQLERNTERAPLEFLQRVEPLLIELMRDAGGLVVLDRRNVLLQADVIDITGPAIARINAQFGDDGGIAPPAAPDAPQTSTGEQD